MREMLMKTLVISILLSSLFVAPAAYADVEQLYFADIFLPTFSNGYIKRMKPNGTGFKSLVSTGDGVRGIAINPVNGEIFWSDANRHVISKTNFNGKNQKDIVTSKLDFVSDVDIDVENNKIYWSDQSQNQIGRANLDGTEQSFIIPSPCPANVGFFCTAGGNLAIDAVNKKLYWTTSYCSDNSCSNASTYLGDILRSDLDGSKIETVIKAIGRPSSIQVDPIGKKIYWTDYVNDVVRRSNLDGTGVDDLFVVGKNNNPNGLTLDLKNGYIYWDQDGNVQDRSCIKRMHLNGKHPENIKCGFGNVPDLEFVSTTAHRPLRSRPAD
jgi:DNA-binding beta-propeller fold protein YncE